MDSNKLMVVLFVGLILAACTSMSVKQKDATSSYELEYLDVHPSPTLVKTLGDALTAGMKVLGQEHSDNTTPPVIVPPITPPVIIPEEPDDPDPITDPVPPTPDQPPYKVANITTAHGTGLLWKPASESTGNLAVLIPNPWGVVEVKIFAPDGVTLIETGDYSGNTNTDRPTYRFDRAGSAFPANCILSIGQRKYLVPSPAQRYE